MPPPVHLLKRTRRRQKEQLTFELVCLFVTDEPHAPHTEVFEDGVDVALHGVEGEVAHVGRVRRFCGELLLLTGAAWTAATSGSSAQKPKQRQGERMGKTAKLHDTAYKLVNLFQ